MQGGKTKQEVDELLRRLHVAEAGAAEVTKNNSDLEYRAEVGYGMLRGKCLTRLRVRVGLH